MTGPQAAEGFESLASQAATLAADIKVRTGRMNMKQIVDASTLAAAQTAAVACHAQLRLLSERARAAATGGKP